MEIYNLNGWKLFVLIISGFLIGISKTGIPGAGMLSIPLIAMIIPAKASTGIVLPMLICGDIIAITYYRKNAVWKYLLKLFPFAMIGIIIGWIFLGKVNDRQLQIFIGFLILILLFLHHCIKTETIEKIKGKLYFSSFFGLTAGITTMMANAAGPIMTIYLLSTGLPKIEFIGTGAWYYFLMNWFKVPFSYNLGFINSSSIKLNLIAIPFIFLGGIIGIYFIKKVPQKIFNIIVEIFIIISAIKLILT